jgi:hypothetical protein
MRQIQKYFSAGQPARFGQRPKDLVMCMANSLSTLAVAFVHRWAGFSNPHHNALREAEKHVSHALPAAIEHYLSAFGVVSLLVLLLSGTRASRRLRFVSLAAFAGSYLVGSTALDWFQYAANGDPAQLWQVAGDMLGLASAAVWLTLSENSPATGNKPGLSTR